MFYQSFLRKTADNTGHTEAPPAACPAFSSISIRRHHPEGGGSGGGGGSTPHGLPSGLHDARAEVRARSAWSIADSADSRALSGLAPLLGDPEYKVREAAAHVMSRIFQRDSGVLPAELVESLGLVLQNDPHAGVRYAAAMAFGHSRNGDAFYPLMAALSDVYPEVAAAAAWSLGELRELRALAPLCIQSKNSQHFNVRAACVRALGKLKNERCFDALAAALKDKDFEVRWEAAEALGELKHRLGASLLVHAVFDKSRDVSEAAAHSLVLMGPIALPAIEAVLVKELDSQSAPGKAVTAVRRLKRSLYLITKGGER